MKYWVRVKFDYSGDPLSGHLQEVKTQHYYREMDNSFGILHVNAPKCINIVNSLPNDHVVKEITQEEFNKVLKDTIEYMGINITNHKFIR
jgi:hypothetical protein